jgi:hypothetical protein
MRTRSPTDELMAQAKGSPSVPPTTRIRLGTFAPFLIIALFFFLAGPAGGKICNIKTFLEKCPTLDPACSQIRKDFVIRREGVVAGDVTCVGPISQLPIAQYTDELIVLQTLRTIYYLDKGRHGHSPWTSAPCMTG